MAELEEDPAEEEIDLTIEEPEVAPKSVTPTWYESDDGYRPFCGDDADQIASYSGFEDAQETAESELTDHPSSPPLVGEDQEQYPEDQDQL